MTKAEAATLRYQQHIRYLGPHGERDFTVWAYTEGTETVWGQWWDHFTEATRDGVSVEEAGYTVLRNEAVPLDKLSLTNDA